MVDRKAHAQLFKRLREQHQATVQATQARLRAQQAVRKKIRTVLKGKAMTVPELAAAIELPTDQVLWHVTAMKKYGLVRESGQDGGYYRYTLVEETEK